MKALFFDCRKYKAPKNGGAEEIDNCLAVFVCVESLDDDKQIKRIVKDINKLANKFSRKKLMLGPFAHLSHDLKEANEASGALKNIYDLIRNDFDEILLSGFNVEKGLLIDVIQGPDNISFRSY